MRRETLAKRYADAHPEEMRNVVRLFRIENFSRFVSLLTSEISEMFSWILRRHRRCRISADLAVKENPIQNVRTIRWNAKPIFLNLLNNWQFVDCLKMKFDSKRTVWSLCVSGTKKSCWFWYSLRETNESNVETDFLIDCLRWKSSAVSKSKRFKTRSKREQR